jgi:hypothetical protein
MVESMVDSKVWTKDHWKVDDSDESWGELMECSKEYRMESLMVDWKDRLMVGRKVGMKGHKKV